MIGLKHLIFIFMNYTSHSVSEATKLQLEIKVG